MRYILILFLISASLRLYGQKIDTAVVTDANRTFISGNDIEMLEDITNKVPFDTIQQSRHFKIVHNNVPNFGLSNSTFWLRLYVKNNTDKNDLLLHIPYPIIDQAILYMPDGKGAYSLSRSGDEVPLRDRSFKHQDIIFNLSIKPKETIPLYLKIRSNKEIHVPIYIGITNRIWSGITLEDLIFGSYIGIILVMLFYNLFIFLTTKDMDYFDYVIYIFFVGLTQFCVKGYGYRFLWNNSRFITKQCIIWSAALVGIASIQFIRQFLHTKKLLPALDKFLVVAIFIEVINIILSTCGFNIISYFSVNILALSVSIIVWAASFKLFTDGFKPAKYFVIAWSVFLLGVIIFVLKDFNVLPYNSVTNNSLLIGSAFEITLLSFALADKINSYKKEKEESQAAALEASQKNERLIKEQNAVLESTVAARTKSLQKANGNLNKAIKDLKSTQSQLVHAEKMASLGQLTAGIAHEINNPINFVKSNIKPLQLDMEDLMEVIKKYEAINGPENIEEKLKEIENFKKQIDLDYISTEIQSLISGIEEGAVRTADIVKGLRTFSRLDESELKQADIHDGMDATLTLLRSSIPRNVSIIKRYGDVPPIECFAGKLNQVFMNILTNSLQAIKSKPEQGDESITITTSRAEDHVIIGIADTGPGMPEEVKGKIFDPFFTTKDVGEGTGLGLSIVLNIIEKHHGEIEVDSTLGKGSEFIITLPMNQENKD